MDNGFYDSNIECVKNKRYNSELLLLILIIQTLGLQQCKKKFDEKLEATA